MYAGHATSVEVCLFEEGDLDGTTERRIPLTERTHGIWFDFLEGVGRASATACGSTVRGGR